MSYLTDQNSKPLSSIVPRNAVAVTPNDSTTFSQESTLWIDVAGDITVDLAGVGSNITYTVPIGPFPYAVTRVYATGTTATGIKRHY